MGSPLTVVAISLAVALFALMSVPTEAQDEPDLEGDHVCYCWVWKSGYERVNVSYPCWNYERKTGSDCQEYLAEYGGSESDSFEEVAGYHHHRWRRTWGRDWDRESTEEEDSGETVCYIHTLETCYRMETRCYSRREMNTYCCNGYEEDGMGGCKKTIECQDNNGGCNQMCKSTRRGKHRCSCMPGYTLTDGTTCVDIDECATGTSGCKHECQNTDGSFFCRCPRGYEMVSATECKEINECNLGNGGCEHTCINTDGAFYCECQAGFDLENGNECHDVDECKLHNGGCSHTCRNKYGGYRCACPAGLTLGANGRTCTIGGEDGTTPFREPLGSDPSTPTGPFPTGIYPEPPIGAEQRGGDDGSISGGAIAGIAIGTILILVALAALLLFLVCLGRRLLASNAAAANAAAASGAGAGAGPPVYVMPVPIKKKGQPEEVVTPGEEKTAYTNMAYDNEVYGTVWGVIPPAVTTPVKNEPVYNNVEKPKDPNSDNTANDNADETTEDAEPVYGNVKPPLPAKPGRSMKPV